MPQHERPATRHSLEVRRLSVRLPGEARPVLDDLELSLAAGQTIGISGKSGAGKSTLLHAISGLVPWLRPAEVNGDVIVGGDSLSDLDPGQRAHLLATCLDRPEAQLFLPTVGQEIEAARRLHGDSAALSRAADRLGVDRMLERKVIELSSGQRQRVALTTALAAGPKPVLLDEPSSHLDGDGVEALVDLLEEGTDEGGSVLLCEQAGWRLARGVGSWATLADGRILPSEIPEPPDFPAPAPAGERVLLRARGLTIERGGQRLLSGIDFELRAGEVVLLTGANGVGKSTMAMVLAGFRRAAAGRVHRVGRVALMLPSAELQLFAGTVAGEVAGADRLTEETARVLRRHRLDHLGARAPWTLSRGERQRLVHAALDLLRPEVMIVDEPGQGLDPEDLAAFVRLVHRRAEKGRGYLVISHRRELASAVHRHLHIVDGGLEERTT